MRIVAGRHKGRRLAAPEGRDTRPTSDRVREAVFNIIEHGLRWRGMEDARVADIFCGTGALGLEALSRGAAHAVLVDNNAKALDAARRNVEALDETTNVTLLRNDATQPMPRPRDPVDLAFLDPPYRSDDARPALEALRDGGWLANDALVVVEQAEKARFDTPSGFQIIDERRYGDTRVFFLRYRASGTDP
ncbi:MAG: 16S rRNA (guanine(966)-N(2))-methyltransferase RsmD [Pseudomonadota bacterium]